MTETPENIPNLDSEIDNNQLDQTEAEKMVADALEQGFTDNIRTTLDQNAALKNELIQAMGEKTTPKEQTTTATQTIEQHNIHPEARKLITLLQNPDIKSIEEQLFNTANSALFDKLFEYRDLIDKNLDIKTGLIKAINVHAGSEDGITNGIITDITAKNFHICAEDDSEVFPAGTKVLKFDQGNGKSIYIYPGSIDDMTGIIADKTLSRNPNHDLSIQKLTQVNGKLKAPNEAIQSLHEYGSYNAFRDLINMNNTDEEKLVYSMHFYMKNILQEIQNFHKDKSVEKEDGYYSMIVQSIVDSQDPTLLELYLNTIQGSESDPQNLRILGTNDTQRVKNRNTIAKRADANKEQRKTQNPDLIRKLEQTKILIDPQIQQNMIEKFEKGMDTFFKTYGPIIAEIFSYFGGRDVFMKWLPEKYKDEFRAMFKEKYTMTSDEIQNFNTLVPKLQNPDRSTALETNTAQPDQGKNIINKFKQDKKNKEDITKNIEANFDTLSPSMIASLIMAYNKDPVNKENPIDATQALIFDGKKPIKIKPGRLTKVNEKITGPTYIKELTNYIVANNAPIWTNLVKTHTEIYNNNNTYKEKKDKNGSILESKKIDINGSDSYKYIHNYNDVATYIAAYLTSDKDKPFNFIMSENDISTEKPAGEGLLAQSTLDKFNTTITTITDQITSGKHDNDNAFPDTYTKSTDGNVKPYENFLESVSNLFGNTTVESGKTQFDIFAEKLTSTNAPMNVNNRPRILKDLITYKTDGDTNKEIIGWLNDTSKIIPTKIEDNGSIQIKIEVDSDPKKSFVIKPGPVFELIANS